MAILEAIPEKWIVVFVVCLITFLQLTANFYVMGPALGGWFTLEAQKILSPLNISLLSLYINYYLACTTDPGHPPQDWEPPSTILKPETHKDIIGFTGPRYCKKCEAYKPPRSHHCKYCGQCILRMDHHCPWIGNCVGFANYPHFVRFVFSVVICCSYGCFLMLWRIQRIIDIWGNQWEPNQPTYTDVAAAMTVFVLAGLVTMIVGVLAIYHTYCLFKGQTTIEGSERTKTVRLVRRRKIDKVEFPFDIGFYENICSILGHNPLLWFWPRSPPGNGLTFPVKPNTDPYIVYSWPPRDPKDLGQAALREQRVSGGPRLVRRDSEGYLVREITMEDRMRMLNEERYVGDNGNSYELEAHHDFIQDHLDDPDMYYEDNEYYEEYPEGDYVDEYVEGEYVGDDGMYQQGEYDDNYYDENWVDENTESDKKK